MKKLLFIIPVLLCVFSCTDAVKEKEEVKKITETPEVVKANFEYGYDLNDFSVIRDTIRSGDTFGDILNANGISHTEIFNLVSKIKDSFDVRRVGVGRPYLLLNSKDSLQKTEIFIYEKNKIEYAVIDLRDCVSSYNESKPITTVEKIASGVITSSLSQTLEDQHLSPYLTGQLADIYAWTIDFF